MLNVIPLVRCAVAAPPDLSSSFPRLGVPTILTFPSNQWARSQHQKGSGKHGEIAEVYVDRSRRRTPCWARSLNQWRVYVLQCLRFFLDFFFVTNVCTHNGADSKSCISSSSIVLCSKVVARNFQEIISRESSWSLVISDPQSLQGFVCD